MEKTITTEEIQGMVSVYDELITRELELKNELKALEKEKNKIEHLMQEELTNNKTEIITCGYYSFGWETKSRTAFDQQKFKNEYPHLYDEFKTTKESKVFKFGHRG